MPDPGAAAAEEGAKRLGSVFIESYARLPVHFFTRVDPTRVADPTLIAFNSALASELGLDVHGLDPRALAEIFSGNRAVPGTLPIAMVYAGHQFGQFVPQLGDGRAILLGEVRDRFGRLRDIQLKGSGRTPYSRSGDGRASHRDVVPRRRRRARPAGRFQRSYRERDAARFMLGHLNDRALKDIGIYRSQIDDGLAEIARRRAQRQRSERS